MLAVVRRGRTRSLGNVVASNTLPNSCYTWGWDAFVDCYSEAGANLYNAVNFGTPAPTGVAPPTPPVIDSTGLIVGSASDAIDQSIAGSIANTTSDQIAAISSAQAAGTYTPAGVLPFTGAGLTTNGWGWLVVGGFAAIFLFSAVKR